MSDTLASWAGIVITTAAVIVALFAPRFHHRIWHSAVDIGGDVLYTSVYKGPREIVGRGYARLQVETRKNRPAAEDLRVYILSCDPHATLGGERELTREKFHIPLQWAFSHLESTTLAPGISNFVDLAELRAEKPEALRLLSTHAPEEGYLLLAPPQTYTVQIAVAAKNMSAKRWEVRVTHVGDWRGHQQDLQRVLIVEKPYRCRG